MIMDINKGIHIGSDVNTLIEMTKIVHNNGGNVVQIFVNIEEFDTIHGKKLYTKFRDYLLEKNIKCLVHASYSINLAREWNEYSIMIRQFIDEIIVAEYIGACGIIVHMGKSLKLDLKQAQNNMFSSLLYISTKITTNMCILLETPAGQGTEMCYKLEDFAYFFKKIVKHKHLIEKFGICIDTCHIFGAGYDLTTKKLVDTYLNNFDKLIGLKYVKLIHLNDCKSKLGDKVDRHANIGRGNIGKIGLLYFGEFFSKRNVPIIFETPLDFLIEDLQLIV